MFWPSNQYFIFMDKFGAFLTTVHIRVFLTIVLCFNQIAQNSFNCPFVTFLGIVCKPRALVDCKFYIRSCIYQKY